MTLMRELMAARCARRRHHLVQHAVDAVAHLELVLERLEVDVRGLVLDRLQQHEVDQLADRVGVGGVLERSQVDRLAAPCLSSLSDASSGRLAGGFRRGFSASAL
jgi:hypothetical protein